MERILMENAAPAQEVRIRPGGCDGCTLCCKVLEVKPLKKAAGTWCQHCTTGAGCGIYASRPDECAIFMCGYLTLPELGAEWKPATSRLIISSVLADGNITVFVDPARPDAWRRQPYYAALQTWSARALPKHGRVVVRIGPRSIVILPDHAVDLGMMASDELIVVLSASAGHGKDARPEVYAAKTDAWAKSSFEIAQGNRAALLAGGFRAGRRLD